MLAAATLVMTVTAAVSAAERPFDRDGAISGVTITPDHRTIVYVERLSDSTRIVAVDQSAADTRVITEVAADDVSQLQAFDDRVVFLRDRDGVISLWAVDVAGGEAEQLSGDLVAGGDVISYRKQGDTVAYRADGNSNERFDIYVAPLGGGAAQRVSGDLAGNTDPDYNLTTDGSHVVFEPEEGGLLSVDVDDLTTIVVEDGAVGPVRATENHIAYTIKVGNTAAEVRTLGEDGTDRRTRTSDEGNPNVLSNLSNAVLVEDGAGDFLVGRLTGIGSGGDSLWRIPIAGPGDLARLTPSLSSTLSPDNLMVIGDHVVVRTVNIKSSLFAAPLEPAPDQTVELRPPAESDGVKAVMPGPDDDTVLFTSDSLEAGEQQWHLAPLDGSSPAVILTDAPRGAATRDRNTEALTADGDLVYVARRDDDAAIIQVPVDGGPDDEEVLVADTEGPIFAMADGSIMGIGSSRGVMEVVPGRVSGLRATAGDGEIALAWTAPTDDGGKPVTGFLIDVIAGGKIVASTTSTTPSVTVDGLTNGQPVTARVRAENKRAEGLTRTSNRVIPVDRGVIRLAGENRFGTGAAVATNAFPDPVKSVYVATGRGFADALTGGPLAARGGAPIVLVNTNDLPQESADELARLAPEQVVILGGLVAVSGAVEDAITKATGVVPDRIAGGSRFSTAAAIAAEFPVERDVFVAVGRNFPDALAGSALAAARDVPILLTEQDELPDATVDAITRLRPTTITILGGEAVVSKDVEAELALLAKNVVRLAGTNRFATAAAIADEFIAPVGSAYLATGRNFPDALTGAAAAARGGNPLLLTEVDRVPDEIAGALKRLEPVQIVILGGEVAVSKDVETAVAAFLRAV